LKNAPLSAFLLMKTKAAIKKLSADILVKTSAEFENICMPKKVYGIYS